MVQNLRSRLSQAAAYPGLGVYTRINSSFRGLRKPLPELAAAYFLSYKRPYCRLGSCFARNLSVLQIMQLFFGVSVIINVLNMKLECIQSLDH